MPSRPRLVRARIFHTPSDPFRHSRGLIAHHDGALLIRDGRIAASGDYSAIRNAALDADELDLRPGVVLPGLVDTHVHFPQVRIIGGLGRSLLDWLVDVALPEEARMADEGYARVTARLFLRALAAHGTTTALVFGAHFAPAMTALFEAAGKSGLRIISGLVVSDRQLRPDLHVTPEQAYRDTTALVARFHGQGRLLYAVTPRFALSTSEPMLEMCRAVVDEHADVRAQTHINENPAEIADVRSAFPWARDYFDIYERHGLAGPRTVLAHNVHPSDGELARMAASGTSIAHCPCSNAALGSGIFPLRRHLDAGIACGLGSDVGGGIGFGILKEGLQAYLMQRVAHDGVPLDAARLLYLATLGGATALGLGQEIGDFTPGKAADFVCLQPPDGSPLDAIYRRAGSPEELLSSIFTLAGAESVRGVWVEGETAGDGP